MRRPLAACILLLACCASAEIRMGTPFSDGAVLQRGNRFFIFTADAENRAKSVSVKRGIVDGDRCQLLDPETLPKQRIIVAGQYFVNDGDRLSIAK